MVFKSSTLKAQFALKMDRSHTNKLGEEFCYFDGKVNRCRGFVSLTASVYHPMMRKLVPLATMECESENSLSVELFWRYFNEMLQKVSGRKDYVFNPIGWITDMAGSNMEGLKRVFGSNVLERVKTCEFHFKECRNRQARKFSIEIRNRFKSLCNALLQSQSSTTYEKAKEDLDNFIAESTERSSLTSWLEWWHKRRAFIFPAFQHVRGGPKMNLAEVVHASWVKRDKMNMSLVDAAYADARDNVQLEVEYKAFCDGISSGGTGPSAQDTRRKSTLDQVRRGKTLGLELLREDISDSDRIATSVETEVFNTPHDRHNASVTCGPRPSTQGRPGRYRSTRSKFFSERLEKAKHEKETIKIKKVNFRDPPEQGLVCTLSTSKYTTYRVCIGTQHSCECPDYLKSQGKDLCKHILWTMLYLCRIPEKSTILQQIFLTDHEIRDMSNNTPKEIPEALKYITPISPQRSRREMVEVLLANDPRSAHPQTWRIHRKEKKRGPPPKCRGCRKLVTEGQVCFSVTSLYVPFEQNFVTETIFYFCPNVQCIKRLPPWTNLRSPSEIHSEAAVSDEDIRMLNLGELRVVRRTNV